jgi:2-polyprenyl-3-methyl-5-hydroxy-6-metoxy-1,4-benzoquinol methylase
MAIDKEYTLVDHDIRTEDSYANLKYWLTCRYLKKVIDTKRELKVLNIGSGGGDFSNLLISLNYKVTSIEPDPNAVRVSKRKYPSLEVQQISLDDFNSAIKFDVITAHDVIEHIQFDKNAIKKISRLLKKNGILILTVPAHQYLFGDHDVKLGHFRRYNRNSITKIISGEFEIVSFRYLGILGIPAAMYYSKFRKKAYPVDSNKFSKKVFDFSLEIEKKINFNLGSSLILVSRKNH